MENHAALDLAKIEDVIDFSKRVDKICSSCGSRVFSIYRIDLGAIIDFSNGRIEILDGRNFYRTICVLCGCEKNYNFNDAEELK